MLGGRDPFRPARWFWSDQYDLNLQYAGFHRPTDKQVNRRYERRFVAFYVHGGRLTAAAALNAGRDLRRLLPLIDAEQQSISPRWRTKRSTGASSPRFRTCSRRARAAGRTERSVWFPAATRQNPAMPHVIRKRGVLEGTALVVFLDFVHTVNDAITAILGALLPTLQDRFDASPTLLAMLVATYWVASSVTQPLFGALARTSA